MYLPQKTLRSSLHYRGKSLHQGAMVEVILHPHDEGIVFRHSSGRVTPANWRYIKDHRLCTTLANEHGDSIATVEHLLAALAGCGIDSVMVECQGAELPIMDGSAAPWTQMIRDCGGATLDRPRRCIRVLEPLFLRNQDSVVEVRPAPGLTISSQIIFDHPGIGHQRYIYDGACDDFVRDLAPARTFGFLNDFHDLQAKGLALGGDITNAVVIGDNGVVNGEGLRFDDEMARHKALDFIGDMSLAGAPVHGAFDLVRPGHGTTHAFLAMLFKRPDAWCYEELKIGADGSRWCALADPEELSLAILA